ncbi:MAG: hypothetical protein IPI69_13210 [Bacteroidales bacterium]|nr:hypothetical protein [Bacteroidales bacterium]
MTHENNTESIFELQCTTTATAHSAVHGSGCNFHQKGPASCGGWGILSAFTEPFRGIPDNS